jgi:beta-galactosidase
LTAKIIYRYFGSGEIVIDNRVQVREPDAAYPAGWPGTSPSGWFDTLTWYGRGPHENYWTAKRRRLGRYTSTVDEQFTPYVYTSESGGKEDVRWLTLTDEQLARAAGCWPRPAAYRRAALHNQRSGAGRAPLRAHPL